MNQRPIPQPADEIRESAPLPFAAQAATETAVSKYKFSLRLVIEPESEELDQLACLVTQAHRPRDLASIAYRLVAQKHVEHFGVFYLDSQLNMIGYSIAAIGKLGNVEPSLTDKFFTSSMTEAGDILGVTVHDHIIVAPGADKWFSLTRSRYMMGCDGPLT